MNITFKQYEEAKKIVEQYEEYLRYEEELDDDDYDERDWEEEKAERRFEEDAERAALCKCGAWQFNKTGIVIHVADCICGAE